MLVIVTVFPRALIGTDRENAFDHGGRNAFLERGAPELALETHRQTVVSCRLRRG